jgi:hypothetical protein
MGILDKEPGNNGKTKLIWYELSNKYDAPVKSINQLSSRLSEIFPKLQVRPYSGRDEMERRGQRYLLGVGFVESAAKTVKSSLPSLPVDTARDTALPASLPKNTGSDGGSDETLTQSAGSDGSDVFSPFVEVCKLVSQFTDTDWQKLMELRPQSQQSAERITPEDAQAIRDIALLWWPEYYPEQMQSLVAQMFAWGTPGTKYSVATITKWFEGEVPEVRERITKLIQLRGK